MIITYRPPIFTIRKINDLFFVSDVALDAATLDDLSTCEIYIRGEVAEMLYLALSGHEWLTSPSKADLMWAKMARCFITGFDPERTSPESIKGRALDYNLAAAVIREWGEEIDPYLGMRQVVRRARGNRA